LVVADPAVEAVVARAAEEEVVAALAVEGVVSAFAVDSGDPARRAIGVVAGGAVVGAADDSRLFAPQSAAAARPIDPVAGNVASASANIQTAVEVRTA